MMPQHLLQDLVVALLGIGSVSYAAWSLMPAVWRRGLARELVQLTFLPPPIARRLRAASLASAGCGCDGCDHAPAKKQKQPVASAAASTAAAAGSVKTTQAQPIVFHRRARH